MGNGWVVVVVVVGGEVTKIEQVRTRGKGEGAQILVISWERNNWKPPRVLLSNTILWKLNVYLKLT